MSTEAMTKAGRQYFEDTYGDTAGSVQSMLNAYYPDLGMYYIILSENRVHIPNIYSIFLQDIFLRHWVMVMYMPILTFCPTSKHHLQ